MSNKELRYALGQNLANLFPQKAVDNYIELIENISESIITAYAINYNVLKIMSGMGSLSYVN